MIKRITSFPQIPIYHVNYYSCSLNCALMSLWVCLCVCGYCGELIFNHELWDGTRQSIKRTAPPDTLVFDACALCKHSPGIWECTRWENQYSHICSDYIRMYNGRLHKREHRCYIYTTEQQQQHQYIQRERGSKKNIYNQLNCQWINFANAHAHSARKVLPCTCVFVNWRQTQCAIYVRCSV